VATKPIVPLLDRMLAVVKLPNRAAALPEKPVRSFSCTALT